MGEHKNADNDLFELEVLNEQTTEKTENGISNFARAFDPEAGVLLYATVSGEVHMSLRVKSFAPDEHNYGKKEDTENR